MDTGNQETREGNSREWEANPATSILADYISRIQSNDQKGSARDPLDRSWDRLSRMWKGGQDLDLYNQLLSKKDPIKAMRDRWLETWLRPIDDRRRRLYNDFVDLWFAAITPTTLNPRSKGLADPLPFLEDFVDFKHLEDRLNPKRQAVYLNAYNVDRDGERYPSKMASTLRREKSLKNFVAGEAGVADSDVYEDRKEIDAKAVRAAFSVPFIYPPTSIAGNVYSEGAFQEPINLIRLRENPEAYAGHKIVILDALGILEDYIIRRPKDLWDAYIISVMTPVVKLAKLSIVNFRDLVVFDPRYKHLEVHWINWDIPDEAKPYVMDWSYSNMVRLFDIGRGRAHKYFKANPNGWIALT